MELNKVGIRCKEVGQGCKESSTVLEDEVKKSYELIRDKTLRNHDTFWYWIVLITVNNSHYTSVNRNNATESCRANQRRSNDDTNHLNDDGYTISFCDDDTRSLGNGGDDTPRSGGTSPAHTTYCGRAECSGEPNPPSFWAIWRRYGNTSLFAD